MASAASGLASLVNSETSAANASITNANSTSSTNSTPTEGMFLQLLVAQMQNQDPLNPTDGTQFVAQLAQFSELEQVIGIRGDIEQAMGINQTSSSTTGNNGTNGTGAAG